MKTISYAITVKDEYIELRRLINHLIKYKRDEDEIVILGDQTSPHVKGVLFDYDKEQIGWWEDKLDNDFGSFKNRLNKHCTKDYIFQIDADEYPSPYLIQVLPEILEQNLSDLFLVPRINTVEGITKEHILKWRWIIDDEGRINYPDIQTRIYRNSPEIKWEGKVHERIVGYKTFATLPTDTDSFCLFHPKSIQKQEQQNLMYERLTN